MADDAIKELAEARDAMVAVLDTKFAQVGEWKAFRAIDNAYFASLRRLTAPSPSPLRIIKPNPNAPKPYMLLAADLLTDRGEPVTTNELMAYIAAHRSLGDDPKKARIVVQSSLSKNERFQSVAWRGGPAWWWAGKPVPVPRKESANLL